MYIVQPTDRSYSAFKTERSEFAPRRKEEDISIIPLLAV
jgi:hypothetical protein